MVRSLGFEHQHGAWLSISGAFYPDYNAVTYLWSGTQSSFEVLGIDVKSLGSDDYVLLSALKVQVAGLIDGAQVAGAKPFPLASRYRLSIHPVALSHTVAAHQDLAGVIELDVATGKGFANRAASELERVIQAD